MVKTAVQTVLFPRKEWSPARAMSWLRKHNFKFNKIHTTENYLRFRQLDPIAFQPKEYITKKLDNGVLLIIGQLRG